MYWLWKENGEQRKTKLLTDVPTDVIKGGELFVTHKKVSYRACGITEHVISFIGEDEKRNEFVMEHEWLHGFCREELVCNTCQPKGD